MHPNPLRPFFLFVFPIRCGCIKDLRGFNGACAANPEVQFPQFSGVMECLTSVGLFLLAGETGKRLHRLLITPRLSGSEINPQRSEFSSIGGLRRAAKNVGKPGNLKIYKTGGCDRSL